MRAVLLSFFVFTSVTPITAQTINTGNITVTVKSENQHPLENVTVQLVKSKDSSLVKTAVTDIKGEAEFEHIVFGSYLAKATMVNHAIRYSAVFNVSSDEPTRISVSLVEKSSEMKEVVVEGKDRDRQVFAHGFQIDRQIGGQGSLADPPFFR